MSFNFVAKYIKDINFHIPNSKSYFSIGKNISNYKVNFDIKSRKIKDKILEVDTNLKLVSAIANNNQINVSILFSSLINLKEGFNDKEKLKKIILVDVPKSVYPEIRKILIFLFEKSGFKKINIDENINFEILYKKNN